MDPNRLGETNMALLLGGIATMIALIAGIVGHIDPTTVLERSGVAFCIGWAAGIGWTLASNVLISSVPKLPTHWSETDIPHTEHPS